MCKFNDDFLQRGSLFRSLKHTSRHFILVLPGAAIADFRSLDIAIQIGAISQKKIDIWLDHVLCENHLVGTPFI